MGREEALVAPQVSGILRPRQEQPPIMQVKVQPGGQSGQGRCAGCWQGRARPAPKVARIIQADVSKLGLHMQAVQVLRHWIQHQDLQHSRPGPEAGQCRPQQPGPPPSSLSKQPLSTFTTWGVLAPLS